MEFNTSFSTTANLWRRKTFGLPHSCNLLLLTLSGAEVNMEETRNWVQINRDQILQLKFMSVGLSITEFFLSSSSTHYFKLKSYYYIENRLVLLGSKFQIFCQRNLRIRT
ncbi:hypothetical protein Ancab_005187 [Ancistrocladus abbreviatus]